MDNRVQQGRDPEWRYAFEHRLGADARTRIRRAVTHGLRIAHRAAEANDRVAHEADDRSG